MKFRVKTPEGELEFQSFGEVERAWLMGLVGPDDELLEEGQSKWRKARSFRLLVNARRTGEQAWGGSWFLWVVLGVVFGSATLWLLKAGLWYFAGPLGFMTAGVMIRVTVLAMQRSKPHGNIR